MAEDVGIIFERDGPIGILTLNRPERLNSLSRPMVGKAVELLQSLGEQGEVRALILTGAGRGFCSGADLGQDAQIEGKTGSVADEIKGGLNRLVSAIADTPFPVITAVNGAAAGAGAGIALAGDILIGAESMRLLLTFAKIGMGLDGGTSAFLTAAIGPRRALAAAMLADPIDAQRARDWGLAWSIVPDAELMPAAKALARRLADGPPLALAAMKKQLRFAQFNTLPDILDNEAEVQASLIQTDDVKEGVTAWRERRTTAFAGR